jgi:hypothetical protein
MEKKNVIIDFVLTDDSFEIHSSNVNGNELSEEEINAMIETIFNPNENDIVN